ncbi:Autophagy-related 3-like protein [Gossypium australe]|uniref:Autophagy-related 3-like protein n=1 Tax=Gossypium australe TaxID=47621 RepID=A0A5B6UKV2_9ROSI|nr:Autophagy-related 3-like protein [Gossypium australe]
MVLSQKIHEAFKGTVERITGPRTVSAFKEKGVLSVSEFILAGDNLVSKCPTWSWYFLLQVFSIVLWFYGSMYDSLIQWTGVNFRESGEPSKRKSYLPPEKQYLITRNVPCLRRAASVEQEYEAAGGEVLLDNEDNDGWLATHGRPKDRNDVEEILPSMETLEIRQNETVRSIPSYFGSGENEEDIPDMADYEEADNAIETDAVNPEKLI